MINTSTQFVDAVYGNIRASHCRINFEIVDVEALNDSSLLFSDSCEISKTAEVTDKTRQYQKKYATYETDLWKLDGTYKLPPKTTDPDELMVGWFSEEISGSDNYFVTEPSITIMFSETHSSFGISLTFADEIVEEFDVVFYDSLDSIVETTHITGNTSRICSSGVGVADYKKIIITFIKTAKPYRRVRLFEIDFGIIVTYEDENIISANVIEEISVTSNEVTSNEIRFTLDNSGKEFSVTNPVGYVEYLQQKQAITAEIGIELQDESVEYVPVGKFYLKEWVSDIGGFTASFTARDKFDELDSIPAPIGASGTLYEIAEGIMIEAGIEDYYIDSALSSYSSAGFTNDLSCREALKLIGLASKSAVYQDRYGVITIKQFTDVGEVNNFMVYSGQEYSGTFYIEVDKMYIAKKIDLDNSFNIPQIKMSDVLKTLEIVIYPSETVYSYSNPGVTKGNIIRLENVLINSKVHADDIAAWIISDMNNRVQYESNWRQNPALEAGDMVAIEDDFNQIRAARLLKQEFDYSGYLAGRSKCRGSA